MADPPSSSEAPDAHAETGAAPDPAQAATGEAGPAPSIAGFGPGAQLGSRYRIVRLLGTGGMGAVYLAADAMLGKEVALKSINASGAVDVLRAEVLLAQRVTHPNVCRTYDLEVIEGRSFIKMEFVDGETLAQRIARQGHLEIAGALAIARSVAAGLAAAHEQGVVHRDLKPQNIMLERGGRVVLMDFGIAHSNVASDHTLTGAAGTPEYIAPEQARGLAVDGRADLYALGCVLYQMLVGQIPFPAETRAAIVLRHLHDPAPDARAERPDLPPWLGVLVAQLLAKEPADRPAGAAVVLAALAGPRKRDLRALGRGVAAALLFTAGLLAVQQWRHRPAWRPLIRELLPAYEENSGAPALSPDGAHLAYDSDRDGSWRLYVGPAAGGPSHAVTPPDFEALYPRWTHDSQSLLFRHDGGVDRVGLADGRIASVAKGAFAAVDCAGRLVLAYPNAPDCPDCARLVVREASGVERELARLPRGTWFWGSLDCDRAGMQVAYSVIARGRLGYQLPADLWIARLDGGAPRPLTADQLRNAWPAFAPDGRSLVFSSARSGHLNLWEMAVGGGAPMQLTFGEGPDLAPTLSSDGSTLIYDEDISSLPLFFQVLPGGVRHKLTDTIDDVAEPLPTPDGREVIVSIHRQGRMQVLAIPLGGAGEERLLADGHAPALTPDGQTVLFAVEAGPKTRLLAVARTGGAAREVASLTGRVLAMSAGPDGCAHLMVSTAAGVEAWRAPLAGGVAERDAPAPWTMLLVAPRGGWLAALRAHPGGGVEAHLYRHGLAAGAPAAHVLVGDSFAWDQSGESLVYAAGSVISRYSLKIAGTTVLLQSSDAIVNGVGVSADGGTVYFSQAIGHVRRQILANFASRPRPALGR